MNTPAPNGAPQNLLLFDNRINGTPATEAKQWRSVQCPTGRLVAQGYSTNGPCGEHGSLLTILDPLLKATTMKPTITFVKNNIVVSFITQEWTFDVRPDVCADEEYFGIINIDGDWWNVVSEMYFEELSIDYACEHDLTGPEGYIKAGEALSNRYMTDDIAEGYMNVNPKTLVKQAKQALLDVRKIVNI